MHTPGAHEWVWWLCLWVGLSAAQGVVHGSAMQGVTHTGWAVRGSCMQVDVRGVVPCIVQAGRLRKGSCTLARL
jgi:hypothetical protein